MGGIGFDIEIEAIDGAEAAPPPALYRAVSDIVTEAIYAFTKRRKAFQAIRVNHDRSYGESGNTEASLSFGFYDGGGGAMIAMNALCHWFTVILAALPLDEIAGRSGYRIVTKRASLEVTLEKEAAHSIFVDLRGAVHEAERNAKGDVVAYADGDGDAVALTAKERALVDEALASKRCPCLVCEALRAGKRPKLPKPPKPPKTKQESSGDGSWARKRQVQLEDVSEFPLGLLAAKRLDRLSVSGSIDELPQELGDVFPRLTSFSLHRTHVTRLPRSLANIAGLRSLYVTFQPLDSVDEIADLASLEYLWLNGVGDVIEKLDCAKLARVNSLHMSHNEARVLPRNIGAMATLDALDAEQNALEHLPPELARTKLGYLNLDNNPLRAIPAVLRELPLKTLLVGHTSLERIDVEHLPRTLDHLSFDNCSKLHELPSLEALPDLTTLNLDYTPLGVPESLRKLEKLEHLSIRQPKRLSIPDWIGELPLKKLVVSASAIDPKDKNRLARLLPGAEIKVL